MVSLMLAPPTVPPEVKTGFVVPVMSELIVRVFAPLWMKNSEAEEVIRPRTEAEPMVRPLLSEPLRRPPETKVRVSEPPVKLSVLAAPLRVRELMVRLPAGIVWVPLNLTLLVEVAVESSAVCSVRFIERTPETGS